MCFKSIIRDCAKNFVTKCLFFTAISGYPVNAGYPAGGTGYRGTAPSCCCTTFFSGEFSPSSVFFVLGIFSDFHMKYFCHVKYEMRENFFLTFCKTKMSKTNNYRNKFQKIIFFQFLQKVSYKYISL